MDMVKSGLPQILLVEDSPIIRKMVVGGIGKHYEVLVAEDTAEGWRMFQQHRPRVVFLDASLQNKGDGFALLSAIKSADSPGDHLVAMLTGDASEASREVANRYGADAYFTKPIGGSSLLRWLQEVYPAPA